MSKLLYKRCVIIGSSPDTDIEIMKKNIKSDDFIVCADGGYLLAQKAGITPNLIIGDFDSSPFPENCNCEVISLPVMKDDTDTNYCVRECIKRGFRDFILMGVTGGRTDHTIANFCTLKYLADRDIVAEMIDSKMLSFVLNEGSKIITAKKGMTFSVFPFGCNFCEITLKGFLYELDRGRLTADFPLGVSNQITDDNAQLIVHNGSVLVIILEDI